MSKKGPRVDTKYIPFEGGLDTETARQILPSGRVRNSKNMYQGIFGGYTTMGGYERFSGKPKPSVAAYYTLPVTLTDTVNVGDVVTDNTAAAYGTVLVNLTTTLVLTKVTGTFAVGNIKVGAAVKGTCSAAQSLGGAGSTLLDAQYLNLAADSYRADIAVPTGSGAILGVWWYKNNWYCFRNNAGGTAQTMFKAGATGWTAVSLGKQLAFTSGGATQIQDGDTIVGEISGATAVVGRVVRTSGIWSAGTAAGKFVFQTQTGNFQAETVRVGASLNLATIAGDSSAITIPNINGEYEFCNANFTGSADTQKMYGCDGQNLAFEFDGTNFVTIETGMTTFPSYIIVHKNHLFLAFRGSIQHSSLGDPYTWVLYTGSDEIGMGDVITGFITQPGNEGTSTLVVFTRKDTGILYGSSSLDWSLVMFKQDLGALPRTPGFVGTTVFLDMRGIAKLSTAQVYGNFIDSTISANFNSWLETKKNQVSAGCISRDKSLYMLFFDDKTALFSTILDGKLRAGMEMEFDHKVSCVCSAEDGSGNEYIMFGSDDGMVYEMFAGTSFDGGDITWWADLTHDHMGTPTLNKRMLPSDLEYNASGYTTFQVGYSLDFESSYTAQPSLRTYEVQQGLVYWGNFTWGLFTWDGLDLVPKTVEIMGVGKNIGFKLYGSSDYIRPIDFRGITMLYYITGGNRNAK